MYSTNQTLLDRVRALDVRALLSRYLTPISIGVLMVGVVMIVLGPVRSLTASAAPAAAPGTSRTGGPGIVASSGSDVSNIDQLSRSLVPFTTIPDRPRKTVSSYTIKAGDTLFGIAGAFGLKPETIFWSNKNTLNDNVHLIIPGVTIAIMPTDGVYVIFDGKRSFDQLAKDYSVEKQIDANSIINSQYNNFAGKAPTYIPAWGTPVVSGAQLTAGLTNRAAYWTPDSLVTQTNLLWELDPVEVVGRGRPTRLAGQVGSPEQAAFVLHLVERQVPKTWLTITSVLIG